MLLLLPCVDGGASGEASSRGWTLSLPLGTAGRMGAAHLCHLSMAAAGPEGCGWKGAVGSREGELRWASPHPLQAARRGGTGLGWTLGVRGHLASPSFGRTASLAS